MPEIKPILIDGILIKPGWKTTKDLQKLGRDTVAAKLAQAEGTTLAVAITKLTLAETNAVEIKVDK